jgi:hypothetical protein
MKNPLETIQGAIGAGVVLAFVLTIVAKILAWI